MSDRNSDGTAEAGEPGTAGVETELDRDIGFVGAVAIGVGTMIAAGIFVLSGLAVSNVGAAAIVSFLIAAVVAAFTAAAYSEFASIYPESGGGYMYVANTFDRDWTYIVGWSMILGYPASAAFYIASFSDWFFRFIYPALSIPQAIPYWVSGLVVFAVLVGVNLKGTEETGIFQIVVTALKIALIILFLYGGLQAFDASTIATSFAQNVTDFGPLFLTSALVFITFFGFEAIATNAEEIEEPGRTIPRAIFFSMGFVTVVYALVVIVIVLALNTPEFLEFLATRTGLDSAAAAEQFVAQNGEVALGRAAQYYLGDFGFYVIIVGALSSMVSGANATILAGSRVKLAMSRRDHLPEQFEDLHPSLNTPYKSVLLTGGLILFYIVFFSMLFGGGPTAEGTAAGPFGIHLGLEAIAHFADFMLLSGLIFVNLAIIQSRRKYPDVGRRFEVPFVPWVPIIAVLANLALLVNVEFTSLVIGLIAEVIGVGFWFAWKGRSPSTAELEQQTPTAVAERNPSGHKRDYQIVVPIANPENVEQLMRTAVDIARDRNGEILVLSVVDLPEQTPLSRGRQYVGEKREVLNRAMALADGGTGDIDTPEATEEPSGDATDVPVSGTVRIAHHVDEAILHTIEQYDSDAVLMGWGGWRARRREVVLGSIVDTVVTEADCDVLVERIDLDAARTVESILLPTAGGPHAELAGEIASAIAHTTGAHVELFRVVAPDDDRANAEAVLEDTLAEFEDVDAEATVVESDDVVETITERSADHDLTVIGASREGVLQRVVFGAIPERVGETAESTVILARRNLGVRSRLKRLLRWE